MSNPAAIAAVGFAGLALVMWEAIKDNPAFAAQPGTVRSIAAEMVTKYRLDVDPLMLISMASIESNFRPYAFRLEPQIADASVGLMQTLLGTARDMYEKGYRAFPRPDYGSLTNPTVSMYFGAAYVDWLKKFYRGRFNREPSEEWIVRAYNGGPGWEGSSARAKAMTLNHWTKYQAAKRRFA